MHCGECDELLQRQLDGEAIADRFALEAHLAMCEDCRCRHAAGQRLGEALELLSLPAPPERLRQRIIGDVLSQQRRARRFRRRLTGVAVLAASLLLAVLAFSLPSLGEHSWGVRQLEGIRLALFGKNGEEAVVGEPVAREIADDHAPPVPSLDDSIAEAGNVVASLTRRTADETVGQTGLLLPESIPTPPMPGAEPPSLELPAEPLREAEEGISAGLEPVASTARRALNLFFREIPAPGAER